MAINKLNERDDCDGCFRAKLQHEQVGPLPPGASIPTEYFYVDGDEVTPSCQRHANL